MLIYSNLVRLLEVFEADEKITDILVKNGARNLVLVYEHRYENGIVRNECSQKYGNDFLKNISQKYPNVNFYVAPVIKYYSTVLTSLLLGTIPKLNGTNYVFYEFEEDASINFVAEAVNNSFKAGFRPVLLNACEIKDFGKKELELLVHNGALIGMSLSFLGDKRKKKVESIAAELVGNKLVHFFYGKITTTEARLGDELEQFISKRFGEQRCRELFLENLIEVIMGNALMDDFVI